MPVSREQSIFMDELYSGSKIYEQQGITRKNQDDEETNSLINNTRQAVNNAGFDQTYNYKMPVGPISGGLGRDAGTSGSGFKPDMKTALTGYKEPSKDGFFTEVGDFLGNTLGGILDTVGFGVPYLIADLTGARWIKEVMTLGAYGENEGWFDWEGEKSGGLFGEDESAAGRWGAGLGLAIGLINPFKWVTKGISLATKPALTGMTKLYGSLADDSMKGLTSIYSKKKGGQEVLAAVQRLGGGASGEAVDIASGAFKGGFRRLFDDAWGIVNDKAYKAIQKGSTQALDEGVAEMTASIMKTMKVSKSEAQVLAKQMITEAVHHSQNSLHLFTNHLAKGILGTSDRALFNMPSKFGKYLGMEGGEVYASQVLGGMISDFAIGTSYHLSMAAFQNVAHLGAKGLGHVTGLWETDIKNLDKDSESYHNLTGDFWSLMGNSMKHGAFMSLIAPTRFIRGGTQPAGQGFKQSIKGGYLTIAKSYKPIRKMSGDDARFRLTLIDDAADGLLHQTFSKLAGKKIANLSDDAAKSLLVEVRKQFAKEYPKFIWSEVGKNLVGSSGRMIAGTLAMNIPNLAQQMMVDPKGFFNAFGRDGGEIAVNIITGMVFSKQGRSFKTGHKSKIWETGDIPQYYATNVNDMMKMRRGLEIMGLDQSMFSLGQGTPMYESTRNHVRGTGVFKEVDEVIRDFYVDRVDHSQQGLKPPKEAFKDYIEKELGYEAGTAEHTIAMEKYAIAEQVVQVYDRTSTDVNMMLREMHGKEAFDLVESINNIDVVKNSKDLTTALQNEVRKAYHKADKEFTRTRKDFIVQAYEALGIDVQPDASGRLVIPDISIDGFFDNATTVRRTIGNTSVDVLKKLIDQLKETGDVEVQGQRQIEATAKHQENFVGAFERSRKALLVHVYGTENVKNGHYPAGGTDGDLLMMINPGMHKASIEIKKDIQYQNALVLFARGKISEAELWNTISPDKFADIQSRIQELKIDQNPTLDLSGVDASKHELDHLFFSRLVELNKLINNKGGNDSPSVSIDQVAGLRRAVRDAIGDVFEKNDSYRELEKRAFANFVDRLKINESGSPQSVGMATQHLINGSRIFEKSGQLNTGIGNFVLRTADGIIMPDVTSLFSKLKLLSPDKLKLMEQEGLIDFYTHVQQTLESSGAVIKFTKNTKEVGNIVEKMGSDKVIELLTQAKHISDVGAIKDLMRKNIPLEQLQKKIAALRDNFKNTKEVTDAEKQFFNDLEVLHKNTTKINNLLTYAFANRDYTLLLNIQKRQLEFDTMVTELNDFMNIDISREGNVNTEYMQQLAKQILNQNNFLSKNYGEINLENYSKYVETALEKSKQNLREKESETLINITPAQFEGKYGMTSDSVKRIAKPFLDRYRETKDPAHIEQAFDVLYRRIKHDNNKRTRKDRISDEEMHIDAFQTIMTATSTRQINKVKWIGDKFELSKDYIVDQEKVGLYGLMKKLGLENEFYVLDKSGWFDDGKGGLTHTASPDEGQLTVFGAKISTQNISIDNPKDRMDIQKGLLEADHAKFNAPKKYIAVHLDESTSVVIPYNSAKRAVIEAFARNGEVNETLNRLFANPTDPVKMDILRKYRDVNNLTESVLVDGVLLARIAQDMPHTIIDKPEQLAEIKDLWKRLKLPEFSKGRVYTPEILTFVDNYYRNKSRNVTYFGDVHRAFESFKVNGEWRNMRFISLADETGDSYFNSSQRFNAWVDEQVNIYGREWATPEQISQMKTKHESMSKSVVDAPTYLTKEAYLVMMAQLGIRREFLHINKNGNIVGFRNGAIKPKGVHVEVNPDGSMVVFYDKTAFFYDPKVDALLKQNGVDGLAFNSGNKINVNRKDKQSPITRPYTSSERANAPFGETIFSDMTTVLNRGQNVIIELPLSTFNVTNISREHSAKSGANMGVHLRHDAGISEWMGIKKKVQEFEDFLMRANSSDYSMTSLAFQLMGKGKATGDMMLAKVPIERILQEGGLVIDQWMGDIVADKLFTYFFEGSKIATGDVGNSSINPMAPPIHHKNSTHDQAIRFFETVNVDGESIEVGRQKIIGSYTGSTDHLGKQFSFLGSSNIRYGGDVSNMNESGFFIVRTGITKLGFNNSFDNIQQVDWNVIPSKVRKDGTISEWKVVGMGYELRGRELIDLNVQLPDGSLRSSNAARNRVLYNEIVDRANAAYNEAYLASQGAGITNSRVARMLERNHDGVHVGVLGNRQPRNQMNDVVINKLSTHETVRDVYGTKVIRKEVATDWRGGNKSEQNFTDAIETQMSDYDYDKSSSFLSAPPVFTYDVAKKAGYGIKMDGYGFAESFFAKLNTKLDSGSEMLKHLSVVSNGAMVRGRLVKMHNIVTYFMNGFKDNKTLGKFRDGNTEYEIKMKPNSDYHMSVDNINRWVEIFIDNYKNPVDLYNIQPIIESILFGTSATTSGGRRQFQGLFEIVNTETGSKVPYIDGAHQGIRTILYNNMVSPINKYLRYNRGMTEAQGGQSNSLKLKDVANGFQTLKHELGNPNLWTGREFKIGDMKFGVDISQGMKTLSDFIIGGNGRTPLIGASQNPFDVAMRTLSTVYNRSVKDKQRAKIVSDVENIMMRAEAGVLLEREGGVFTWDRTSETQKLWDYVKNDMDYIGAVKLKYRIDALEKQEKMLKQYKYSDKNEMDVLSSKITRLKSLLSDLEIRLGSQHDYENYSKITVKIGKKDKGEFYAQNADYVFWDPSTGKIAGVVEKGRSNKGFEIKAHWVAVVNGRRFQLVDPNVSKTLHSKLLAFGSLPVENVPGSGDMTFMTRGERDRIIGPVYFEVEKQFRTLQKSYMGDIGKPDRMSNQEYATERKSIINRALNHESIDTPLKRKALLWMMLNPKIDNKRIAYFKDADGMHVNKPGMYENPLNKAAWSLLMDISNGESYYRNNNINKMEATNLVKEIVGRQTLAALGLKNPHLEVALDYSFGDYNARANRNLYIELNRSDIKKSSFQGPEADRALDILNQFINGDRLLTPAEIRKVEDLFDISGGQIFLTKENGGERFASEPKRVFGRPKEDTPIDYVGKLIENTKNQRKTCK